MKIKTLITSIIIIVIVAISCIVGWYFYSHRNDQKTKSILIYTLPTKLEYYVDESLDVTGLSIKGVKYNGETFDISLSDCEISGFDSTIAVEKQVIYIEYKEFSTSFNIKINEKPVSIPRVVGISIYQSPNKLEYKINESFDSKGGVVKVIYSNETFDLINLVSDYVSGFDSSVPNKNLVLTVSYKGFKTTFSVKVVE